MKLALGTVQFGLSYGIANKAGRVSEHAVADIINIARAADIKILDTAAAYGDSEKVLGINGVEDFNVISKLPPRLDHNEDMERWVVDSIKSSLANLGCRRLYGVLMHRPLDLLEVGGSRIWQALVEIREAGLVDKIGASVYGPDDLDSLEGFDFDLVQAPMNILDRRLKNSGWLERLHSKGTEVHVRSAFLQGLLLMPKTVRPRYFDAWSNLLADYDDWVEQQELTPLEACMGFLNGIPELDHVVIGVDSVGQLEEILSASDGIELSVPRSIQSDDVNLINPSLWQL
jgi:aryl-alcohol dehydrogenase-like predicted oxidoreductase